MLVFIVVDTEGDEGSCIPTATYVRQGLTENAGRENDGPSKLQGMKLHDMKLLDQCAGREIAGRENDGPICRT